MQEIFQIKRIIERFPDLNAEIRGNWIWITGKTRNHIRELKILGCKFAPKKKCWSYHVGRYYKKSKDELTLDEIRNLYPKFERR